MPNKKNKTEKNGASAPGKRSYNSPLREQQSRETRNNIVSAGFELVHGFTAWDWTNLTARAVGERAGVSERTVQRYFPNERALRDAVLERMVEDSGVDLGALCLGEFADVIRRMFSYLSSFAVAPEKQEDPSFASIDRFRRESLLAAVERAVPDWSDDDRKAVAAALDIFWNPPLYERLVEAWELDADRAVGLISWLVTLIERAVQAGERPGVKGTSEQ
jgi:AcrR family transcriptional regulator